MHEKATLSFYVNAGILTGKVNGTYISFAAVSGGGGGAKGKFPDNISAVNNPFKSDQQESTEDNIRGGAIPVGTWKIGVPSKHGHLGLAARLSAISVPSIGTRGGFFIHGRGPRGSDGCIVPMSAANFHMLMEGLEASGGGTLSVFGVVDIPDHLSTAWV